MNNSDEIAIGILKAVAVLAVLAAVGYAFILRPWIALAALFCVAVIVALVKRRQQAKADLEKG